MPTHLLICTKEIKKDKSQIKEIDYLLGVQCKFSIILNLV
jgi:hypothetical protein